MSPDDALRRSIIQSSLKSTQRALQPARNPTPVVDIAALVVGGLLAVEGLKAPRRGWIATGLGLAVFYQGLCGLAAHPECLRLNMPDPQVPDDEKIPPNPVDEAAWESFPASDPPTFAGQIG